MTTKKVVTLLLVVAIALSGCIEILNEGEHAGQITAVEKNGLIWKTWSIYVKSEIESSQEDRYCVENDALIPELKQISATREKIVVFYRDELYKAPWRCSIEDSAGIITGVKTKK